MRVLHDAWAGYQTVPFSFVGIFVCLLPPLLLWLVVFQLFFFIREGTRNVFVQREWVLVHGLLIFLIKHA